MRSALTRRAVAALPLAAIAGTAPVTGALVDLGARWKAFADQRDACFEAEKGLAAGDPRRDALDELENQLYEQQATIEEAIFDAPAADLPGLAVKARLLARLNDCGPLEAGAIENAMQAAPDFADRCALSLALDIVRLSEKARLA